MGIETCRQEIIKTVLVLTKGQKLSHRSKCFVGVLLDKSLFVNYTARFYRNTETNKKMILDKSKKNIWTNFKSFQTNENSVFRQDN